MKLQKLAEIPSLKYLNSTRQISTCTIRSSSEDISRPWHEVPQPRRYPIVGNVMFLKKENMTAMHKMHKELREEFGDTYKTEVFGDTFLHIHNPEDGRTLLTNDGALPIVPGFERFSEFRKTELPSYFSQTSGLVSQGMEWHNFRKKGRSSKSSITC